MSTSAQTAENVLRRLDWTVLRRLDGLLHGDYRTLFRGFGLDLADLREYQYHDDVRYIDWNVTARLDTPFVREYNEEREVNAWFLLDLSPSVDFGSAQVKKRNVAADFVTVLARILTRRGNRVGQEDSPFVLVAGAADGRWGVFQRNFDMPQASFDGMQEACDYAIEIAKTRLNSMVLIRKRRDPAANPGTKSECDFIGK